MIDENPLDKIISEINDNLGYLLNSCLISKKLHNLLLADSYSKLGSIRILPKLHKEKFSIRPIISYKNHPTNNICVLFDLIIKPIFSKMESFIKDSQNLIRDSIDLTFDKNAKLYSCDFDSLYSNINHEHCLNVVTEFLAKYFDFSEIVNSYALRVLLKMILGNNFFKYENSFFKQKGV